MGCAIAMVFTAMGASYGMAKSGIGVMAVGVLRPDKVMQSEFGFQSLAIHSSGLMVFHRYDASHHGQYSVDLWFGHRRYHLKRIEREIGFIYRIYTTWCWNLSWSLGAGYWVRWL
jgi:hypothetical protein